MRKITDFIINNRHIILILFIILTVISAIVSTKVKTNYDMAEYLPDTSETRIGMDIMEEEFSETETSTLNIMFENLEDEEKLKIENDLKDIDGVEEVDYDDTEEYNKDKYTLYVISVKDEADSAKSRDVYNNVVEKYKDYTFYTSGNIYENNKTVLPVWIVALAVLSALVILLIMCESYVEPFLFLTSILMAVILNNGTNIIFPSISNITKSITAILQLALSMDYSIMLINRYNQEKLEEKDKVKAMKGALYKAFKAISSSSVTTIVGLLALIFMSFKIGKDLGFVLAKGVLFSLICIFFVLPDLILIFDKWIVKSKKKSPTIKLDKLGKFSNKMRFVSGPIFIVIFIVSFILKGNLGIDYTDTQNDEIDKIFPENNQIAIIYKNKDEEKISKYLDKIEDNDKVDEVLAYGNTINEKLTYDKLNSKLSDLGSDVNVEDYLLKIIYYDYYNKNNSDDKMTFDQFINFIEETAYNNEKLDDKIDDDIKKDVTRLKNFVTEESINQKRTSSEIANILDIDESDIKDILIYYLSKNNNIKINLNEFINFMNNDVLTNQKYSSKIDSQNRSKLDTLSKFVNRNTIQSKLSSSEMAKLFGIDNNTMNDLYKYYILVNDIEIKMSLSEFSSFVLNNVMNDSNYSNSFDEQTIQNIKLLSTFSDLNIINKQMNSKELSSLFGIEDKKINQILLLKYLNSESQNKLSLSDFINNTIFIKNNTNYLDGVDISKLEGLANFTQSSFNTKPMKKQELKLVFDNFKKGLIDNIYLYLGLPDEAEYSPESFVNTLITMFGQPNTDALDVGVFSLDDTTLNNLKLLKLLIDDSKATDKIQYTANQISQIFGLSKEQVNQLYNLISYMNGNTDNWTFAPYEFVKTILDNKERAEIKDSVDENILKQLQLLSTIMESSLNNKTYTYQELSNTIGLDISNSKNIYTLYVSSKNNTKLTPLEFANFVLNHKNDSTLSNRLTKKTTNDLTLVKSVMDGVINNKRYNSSELSSLLGINREDLNLLYGLYDSKYIDKNLNLSLKEFIKFLLNDVVTNPEYSKNFDETQISRLDTVNGIMNSAVNKTEYTSNEIFGILSNLSNDVEKNTIEVLYIYYGSYDKYDDKWEMTVEEFVNFLNDDILKDERFTDFIEDDMRQDITDAKKTIKDAKELLIGKENSRVVLNTKFDVESPETFEFVQNLKDMLNGKIEDFYVIGNSPMSYEISQTFNDELNLITIITMLAIFVVVAITFKSIIIPIILVLLIQTAVYLTMGILSFTGENVYFISILIVQSILMGATIDYAILYTTYYLENRKDKGIKEAIIASYNSSINTILTSSSILIIVTLIIANFTSAIASKICKTVSEGTLCSTILILTLLPAVLALWDKFIIKSKKQEK